MSLTLIIILILVGFALLLLEVLVLPGTNVAGILGFVLLIVAVWQTFASYGRTAGLVTIAGVLLLSVISLAVALKSGTWKKATLSSAIDSRVNVIPEDAIHTGDTGKAVSRLAPTGKAKINNQVVEVKSSGQYIEPGTPVKVVMTEGNKIIVEPINE
ncbi:MAG: hypothetical protein Kow00127_03940 [Bacteroidales bacterium]